MITGRKGVVLAALAAFGLALCTGGAAGEQQASWQEQRREAVRLYAALGERERALAAELLLLNARLLSMQEEEKALRRELARLGKERTRRQEELKKALQEAAAAEERLKKWLVARYETGNLAWLAILGDASGWEELAYRAELVTRLLTYEAGVFRDARQAMDARQEALAGLRRTEAAILSHKRELNVATAQVAETQRTRAALLARVHREALGAAAAITALERCWFDSLTSLRHAFGVLHFLAQTGQLKPDRIAFAHGGLRLEISDRSLERQLRAAGGEEMPGISIHPDGIVLAQPGAGYRVRGRLEPVQGTAAVRFVPDAVLLDGIPVQPDVLAHIAGASFLTLTAVGAPGGVAVREIRYESGRLVLEVE